MKKLLVGLTAFALLAFATPALAICCPPFFPGGQISADNDGTTVVNYVTAYANTGGNGIANSSNSKGYFGGSISSNNDNNKIDTGNATAYAGAINVVNSNLRKGCCDGGKQITIGNDNTLVGNLVVAAAFTGDNGIANSTNKKGCFSGNISSNNDNNKIDTGNASAYAGAINVVNSNLRKDCCDGKQVTIGNDDTFVGSEVMAQADTGFNTIADSKNKKGHFSGTISSNNYGNQVYTGNALSKAGAITVVNSNVTRGFGL